MVEIVWAKREEYDEIISFADEVFDEEQGYFLNLVPKIYKDKPELAEHHIILRENGELMGLLLCHIQKLVVAGKTISFAEIGTVSVSSKARGKGYMGQMLTFVEQEMKAKKITFCSLGGQRQRYEHYGYIPAGMTLSTLLTWDNLRHTYQGKSPFTIAPLTEDSPYLADAVRLHNNQLHHVKRKPEDFVSILSCWGSLPYVLLKGDTFAGYINYQINKNNMRIDEILLTDWEELLPACSTLFSLLDTKANACLSFYNTPFSQLTLASKLLDICQSSSFKHSRSFFLLDHRPLIEAYLLLKASYSSLSDGYLELCIEKTPLSISIEKGVITVEELSSIPNNIITLSAKEATQLLFSAKGFLAHSLQAPADWFPLPLFVPLSDCC